MKEIEALANATAKAKRMEDLVRSRMAKPGELGLSAFLDARRIEYLIPDEAFSHQAVYERILVMQIDAQDAGETFLKDGVIIKTQVKQAIDKAAVPRGIIVSAGLKAMDHLVSHGMELGNIVTYVKQAIWQIPVGKVEEVPINLLVLRSADIIACEDGVDDRRSGRTKVEVTKDKHNAPLHYIVKDGEKWSPLDPTLDPDY